MVFTWKWFLIKILSFQVRKITMINYRAKPNKFSIFYIPFSKRTMVGFFPSFWINKAYTLFCNVASCSLCICYPCSNLLQPKTCSPCLFLLSFCIFLLRYIFCMTVKKNGLCFNINLTWNVLELKIKQ